MIVKKQNQKLKDTTLLGSYIYGFRFFFFQSLNLLNLTINSSYSRRKRSSNKISEHNCLQERIIFGVICGTCIHAFEDSGQVVIGLFKFLLSTLGNVEGVHDYQLDINIKIIFMGKRCVTSNGCSVSF